MRQQQVDGQAIDGGPTVFTMRWVFDQILAEAGSSLADLLRLTPLSVLARHAWRGHDAAAGPLRRPRALGRRHRRLLPARPRRGASWPSATRRGGSTTRWKARTSAPSGPRCSAWCGDLGPRGLGVLAGLGPFAIVWRALARHFHDPRLQQLFGRYATYCGASPWAAPATLMLVAQVEHGRRLGGRRRHARAGAAPWPAWPQRRGVRRCATASRVRRRSWCSDGRACGVRLAGGEHAGGRFGGLQRRRAGAGHRPAGRRQPRPAVPRTAPAQAFAVGLTWAMHARTQGFPLVRHNVFFDDDYRVRVRRHLPAPAPAARGTVYVCAQDRDDDDGTAAPARPRAPAVPGQRPGRRRPPAL